MQVREGAVALGGSKIRSYEQPTMERLETSCTAAKHGTLGCPDWQAPLCVSRSSELARPGYSSTKANEYHDEPDVLKHKVARLADLLRKARCAVLYAGAGLSTASGIGDYASKASGSLAVTPQLRVSPYCAQPNLGHRAVAAMAAEKLFYRIVQQNHDGLPQKAGVPQWLMNEIHGAWFDPSNPVVAMSGSLREDLFSDVLACEQRTDLVLAVGSSLSGMNADRLVDTVASRAQRGEALGSVIISLQRTPHDASSSLRIFAKINTVFELLLDELGLAMPPPNPRAACRSLPTGSCIRPEVFLVRYNGDNGEFLDGNESQLLDLREGARLRINGGPSDGEMAEVLGKNIDEVYRISIMHTRKKGEPKVKALFKEVRLLGPWWIAAAVYGEVRRIPVSTPAEEQKRLRAELGL